GHVVARISGAADTRRIADFLAKQMPGVVVRQDKGPKGESIRVIDGSRLRQPIFALVRDSDLIICASPDQATAGTVFAQVLEVRAGKQKGLSEGKLGRLTKEAPRNARTLIAYELSEKASAQFARAFQGLPAAPRDLLVYVTTGEASDATKTGKLSIVFSGRMKDADEAKTFADAANKLKEQGLKALDNVPPREKMPPALIKGLKDILS